MIDTWNLDYAAIALVVSAVALFGLYQAPHLHRLNPGWAALLVALVSIYERTATVWLMLAVLGLWVVRDAAPLQVQAGLVAFGAAATALEFYGNGTNLPWVLLLAVPALGAAMVRAGDTIDDETVWILLVVTVVGQWAGAPDTEGTVVLVVVVTLFAVDALRSGAHVIPATWWPLVAAVLWASAFGSLGKQSAMAGCLACFGVLVAEPIRSWIVEAVAAAGQDEPESEDEPRVASARSWEPPLGVMLLIHVPSVLVASRVAAVSSSPRVAVGVSLVVVLVDVIALEIARRQLASQRVPLGA